MKNQYIYFPNQPVFEYLAGDTMYGQRVLAIDLDPQSNLTTGLMSEEVWEWQYNNRGLTLPFLFKNAEYFFAYTFPLS